MVFLEMHKMSKPLSWLVSRLCVKQLSLPRETR
jgi:hypothetical protein